MKERACAVAFLVVGLALVVIDLRVWWLGTVFHGGPLLLVLSFLLYRRKFVIGCQDNRTSG